MKKSGSRTGRKKFLIFGNPLIEEPEMREVLHSLKTGWLSTGPKVKKFEQMFRKYKGSKFAIALNSCTAALHLSAIAAGIEPNDEVIVPTMTFAATVNSVVHAGARPVFVDCKKDTMNMDLDDVRRKITPRTKAIIPVHFAGRPCDMEGIMNLAKKHRLKVIEDCAHAIEAEYHGRKLGTFGDTGCFSFYVTKNITTGEGGMVITDHHEYEEKIKVLAFQGMSKDAWRRFSDKGYRHYQIVHCGYKNNMMDIQAAIGIHQLPRVQRYWKKRAAIWDRYNGAFRDLAVFTPAPVERNTKHSYHLYTLLLDKERLAITRDRFLDELTKRKIGVGVHYIAVHLHPYYQKNYGYRRGDFPNAEYISDRTVSLPLSAKLTADDIRDVIAAVREVLLENMR